MLVYSVIIIIVAKTIHLSVSGFNDLLDDLPDDLVNLTSPAATAPQNGAKDPTPIQQPDNTPQKHQQLSQLLSSTTPTPPPVSSSPGPSNLGTMGVPNSVGTLNALVGMPTKNTLPNSLGSPPGMLVSKPSNATHTLTQDLLSSSAGMSVFNSMPNSAPSGGVGTVTLANALNAARPATSQALLHVSGGTAGIQQHNQLMNGPHFGLTAQVRPGGTAQPSSLPGGLVQAQVNIAGGINTMNNANLGSQPQQALNQTPGMPSQQQMGRVKNNNSSNKLNENKMNDICFITL